MSTSSVNFTEIENLTGFLEVANTNTGGSFWVGTIWMLWLIMFISMLGFGVEASLLGASFACFTIGVVLTYMGLLNWAYTAMFFGIILAIIFWKVFNSSD